jgi:hypothetical protein
MKFTVRRDEIDVTKPLDRIDSYVLGDLHYELLLELPRWLGYCILRVMLWREKRRQRVA